MSKKFGKEIIADAYMDGVYEELSELVDLAGGVESIHDLDEFCQAGLLIIANILTLKREHDSKTKRRPK